MTKCEMKNCPYDNLTKGPFCTNCNANIATWSRKPLSKFLKRKKNLAYYADRMTHVNHAPKTRRAKK